MGSPGLPPSTIIPSPGYGEDTPHVSGDSGTMALAVRHDATSSLVNTDGDYAPLQVDSNGRLKVDALISGASGGTAMVDDAAFTVGTTFITPAGGTYKTTRDTLDDNDGGAIALNAKRGQYVTLENSSSTEIGTGAAPVRVDPTGTTTQPISDAGGSLTVDGTIAATQSGTWNVTNISGTVSLPTGAATSALQTQPGVDIGDVTINNASGASAVNIQDGGNSITVDGTVAATQSGTWNVTNVSGTVSLPTGAATSANQVTLNGIVVSDGGGTSTAALTSAQAFTGTPTAIANTKSGFLAITLNRGLHCNVRESGGTEVGIQAKPFYIRQTDGANNSPIMDTVGRPGFQKITDGTNTMPTMDVVGRPGFQKITDGTNTMPTMDVGARSGFHKLFDGSGAFNAALTVVTNLGGLGVIGVIPTDLTGNLAAYKSTGEGYHFVASTDNTLANAKYLKVDSNGILQAALVGGTKASYSSAKTGLATAVTATDIFTITGSGTKTIAVTQFAISGTATTALTTNVQLIKRSTADSGGTSATETNVPHDSNNAAATAVITSYTANPTLGTAVGTIRSIEVLFPVATAAPTAAIYDFGIRPSQPIILRGTGQQLCVNLNSITILGSSLSIWIEWTEE